MVRVQGSVEDWGASCAARSLPQHWQALTVHALLCCPPQCRAASGEIDIMEARGQLKMADIVEVSG